MEITFGNISSGNAERLRNACQFPNPDWEGGDTEPWIIQLVATFLLASGAREVLELGGYHGACSRVLADVLGTLWGGRLTVVEHDKEKVDRCLEALKNAPPNVACEVWHMDALAGIENLRDHSVELAWVDDCHSGPHVIEEIHRLIPKMRTDGLILMHDVCGMYGLHYVAQHYRGIGLNLPRVSNSGGLGIIQVRPAIREIGKMNLTWPPVPEGQHVDHHVIGPDKEPWARPIQAYIDESAAAAKAGSSTVVSLR